MNTSSFALIITSLPVLADPEIVSQDLNVVERAAPPPAAVESGDAQQRRLLTKAAVPGVYYYMPRLPFSVQQLVNDGAVGGAGPQALELRDPIVDPRVRLARAYRRIFRKSNDRYPPSSPSQGQTRGVFSLIRRLTRLVGGHDALGWLRRRAAGSGLLPWERRTELGGRDAERGAVVELVALG